MISVIRMIAMTMLPVSLSRTTSRMKNGWKIGVNRNARKSPGGAGARGIEPCGGGVAAGAPLAPGLPVAPAQAVTTRATRTTARYGTSGSILERRRERVTGASSTVLADGVVAARMAGMAASDPAHPQPAATDEPVPVDRLLGVARAGRFVAAARGEPGEGDPVQPDEPDPDPLHEPACPPPTTPPRWRTRRNVSTRLR